MKRKLKTWTKKLAMINVQADNAIKMIENINSKIDSIKLQLDKENLYDAQGAILRSKVKWTSQAEHSTKYFFSLEKRNAKNKVMNATYDSSGTITKNQGTILRLQAQFYEKLYTADPNFACTISGQPDRKISEEEKSECDKDISMEELEAAVKGMARRKSPGLSGLPIDFYMVFWLKLKEPLYKAIKFAMENRCLHPSAREGLISLIPKKERDLLYIKHWRPIVLLDTVFKIAAKIMANRIKKVLGNLIHESQTGFVKGRLISENLRKLLDVIERNDLSGLLISVDFENAFDKVMYEAVSKIMHWFNFGQKIIKWINVLFTNFKLSTYNNGYISEPFAVTKGLFQGNPIAPYLFIIVIECLATKLQQNKKIKGLKIGDETLLLTLFADDLGIVLDHDQASWNETMQELLSFQNCTGMRINYEKTVIYRLGSLRKTNAKFYTVHKMHWSDKPINMLGITLADNHDEIVRLNYEPLIRKAESILNLWLNRNLSLFGKILIINSLVASLFVYKFTVLPTMPEKYRTQLEELFKKFIWNGGKQKIPLEILKGLKQDGGAGLVDLRKREESLKLQWVVKLEDSKILEACVNEMLKNRLGRDVWKLQATPGDLKRIFPFQNFWTEILVAWTKLNSIECNDQLEVKSQFLWYNRNIQINGNSVMYWSWYRKGIKTIDDLCKDEENLLNYEEFCEKYNINVKVLSYLGLLNAIPRKWKNLLKVNDTEQGLNLYSQLSVQAKPAKYLYYKLCSNYKLLFKKTEQINKKCDIKIESEDLIKFIVRINCYTICVKLRSFQYRLLMSSMITNVHLRHYGIKDSDTCTLCELQKETQKHLMYDCRYVKPLWSYVCKLINKKELTYYEIITNEVVDNPRWAANAVVLIVKYYIYSSRCMKTRISKQSCENYIRNYINVEESIARSRNKLSQHKLKWSDYKEW